MTNRLYEESIVQTETCCWLCGNTNPYLLERHEIFYSNPLRAFSIEDKLTVLLCGDTCHRNGPLAIHNHKGNRIRLQQEGQQAAMDYYGWSVAEFAARYGKNYLDLEW